MQRAQRTTTQGNREAYSRVAPKAAPRPIQHSPERPPVVESVTPRAIPTGPPPPRVRLPARGLRPPQIDTTITYVPAARGEEEDEEDLAIKAIEFAHEKEEVLPARSTTLRSRGRASPVRMPSPASSQADTSDEEVLHASVDRQSSQEVTGLVPLVFSSTESSEVGCEPTQKDATVPVAEEAKEVWSNEKVKAFKKWRTEDGEDIDECAMETEFMKEKKADKQGVWDCQASKIFFTYASHIPKDALEARMIKLTSGQVKGKFSFWRAAHESGDKTAPYMHTHVLVDWGMAFKWKNQRLFDWVWPDEGIWAGLDPDVPIQQGGRRAHAHAKPVGRRAIDMARCKWYLGKEDPANDDLKGTPSLVIGIQKCATENEALVKYVKSPGHFSGVMGIYGKRRVKSKAKVIKPKLWQKELLTILEEVTTSSTESSSNESKPGEVEWIPGHYERRTVDGAKVKVWVEAVGVPKVTGMGGNKKDRRIIVIHDTKGNTGKTKLGMSLAATNPEKYLYLPGTTTAANTASVIKGALAKGWSGHTAIVDLTKDRADQVYFYSVLEMLRNGSILVTKWEGGVIDWDAKHIVVMTNWMLDFSTMSGDRWEVFTIMDNFTLRWVSLEDAAVARLLEAEERRLNDPPKGVA